MIDDNLNLLLKYPLISSKIRNGSVHYTGCVMCGSRDVNLHIIQQKTGENVTYNLETQFGTQLDQKIAGIKVTNITDYIDNIVTILRHSTKNHVNSFKRILHEYSEFTRFYINIKNCNISDDLSQISVTSVDEGGREHSLTITVDLGENKDIFKPVNLDIPDQYSKQFPEKFSNLTEIYSKFLGTIEELQTFFDVMEEIDENCGVLDPEKPSRKDCHRRIWLDQNLSLVVIIDPLNVRARPELKFLGPERLVNQYLERLNEKLEDWDENCDLLDGLLNILGLEKFPQKPKCDKDVLMDVGDCCICFSLRLDGKMPEIICGNKSCENFFHVQCLYEWLSSVNSKRILNQIHGQCPNCEKGISCPLPEDTAVT